jgi:hypothetical protein
MIAMRHNAVVQADPGKSVSIPDHIVLTRRFDLQPNRVISASGLPCNAYARGG